MSLVFVGPRSGIAWLIVAVGLVFPSGQPPFAQQPYYRWVDEKGVVHYSQFPPPSGEAAPATPAPPKPVAPEPTPLTSQPATRPTPKAAASGPATTPFKITVARETTYLVAPLRADGTVDYAAALNERYGQGVTPDNNAAVLLLRAFGPGALILATEESRAEVIGRLGMGSLPGTGDYWTSREPDGGAKAYRAPWQDGEYPAVVAWLKTNETPLALVVEASKRPRFWTPVVEFKNGAISISTFGGNFHSVGRALGARAMRKLQSGDTVGAWSDLLAGQRLARLLSHGGTVISMSFANGIDGTIGSGVEALAASRKITPAQARAFLADLKALPPFASIVDIVDQFDRLVALNNFTTGRSEVEVVEAWKALDEVLEAPGLGRLSSATHIDWNEMLRTMNRCYDRAAAVLRKAGYAARAEAARAWAKEVKARQEGAKQTFGLDSVNALLRTGPDAPSRATLGQALGWLICPINPELYTLNAMERGEARVRLNQVVLAVAAYLADKGSFPTRLAALTPAYLPAIPKDPFTDQALGYERRGGGYLLYSVGPNGKPDTAIGEKAGDDIVVKVE